VCELCDHGKYNKHVLARYPQTSIVTLLEQLVTTAQYPPKSHTDSKLTHVLRTLHSGCDGCLTDNQESESPDIVEKYRKAHRGLQLLPALAHHCDRQLV
jgi:hypothetical protein